VAGRQGASLHAVCKREKILPCSPFRSDVRSGALGPDYKIKKLARVKKASTSLNQEMQHGVTSTYVRIKRSKVNILKWGWKLRRRVPVERVEVNEEEGYKRIVKTYIFHSSCSQKVK
jgi:hypothetical protein